MALSNKEVLDALNSLGQKDAVQHVIEACSSFETAPLEASVRVRISELKRKHASLKKSSARQAGKRALLDFYNKEFHVPLRDATRAQRFYQMHNFFILISNCFVSMLGLISSISLAHLS